MVASLKSKKSSLVVSKESKAMARGDVPIPTIWKLKL
jgi:hypothetical protein